MSKFILVLLIAFICGCASSFKTEINMTKDGINQNEALICPNKGVTLIILPIADGVERNNGTALNSGKEMAIAFRNRLLKNGFNALISEKSDIIDNIKDGKEIGAKYILKADITEWDDNATNWSFNPDRINVNIDVYEVEDNNLLLTLSEKAKSPASTLVNNPPDVLIPELVKKILSKIFCRIE